MSRIMFVIGGLASGGAERVVTTISSALQEKHNNVSLMTYYKTDNEYEYSDKINRITIFDGEYKDFGQMSSLEKIRLIRKNIKKEKPDDIICFLPNISVYTYIATLFTKYNKRLVFTVRANPNTEKGKINKIHKILFKFVKRIITQNEGQKKCFSNRVQKKITIIPNPMYDELFLNEKVHSTEVRSIVSVGRLTEQKNYPLAIEAFEKISQKYPNINYYIYGSGPLEESLHKMVTSKNLQERIHRLGFEKDRNVIYGDKDIFLMTSKFEGMPNALAEAMCKEIPAISTDCDFGPRDLIMNEDMGILLKGYEVDKLEEAFEKIINNYEDYIIKAKNAKEILKNTYSFNNIVDKWVSFLEK